MKSSYTLYDESQILLAAVRLFRHREKRPPSIQELAEWTGFSVEAVHHLCNRLERIGALERIRGAFEDHVALKDPLEAEKLREVVESADIEADVKKWKEHRAESIREVEKRFSGDAIEREKEDLFSKIEERLRKGGRQESPSPLDALFRKDLGKKDSS
ncbi:MAG: hypothetical protein AB1640_01920 [bacterium]